MISDLQKVYDRLSEKIQRLREAWAIESDPTLKFKLEKQIEQTEEERAQIEQKMGDSEKRNVSDKSKSGDSSEKREHTANVFQIIGTAVAILAVILFVYNDTLPLLAKIVGISLVEGIFITLARQFPKDRKIYLIAIGMVFAIFILWVNDQPEPPTIEISPKNGQDSTQSPIVIPPDNGQDSTQLPIVGPVVIPPPPKTYYTVILTLPSRMSDAKILVDGKPANIIKSTPLIIKIIVAKKETNHQITVKKDDRECSKEIFIRQDGLRLQPCQ